ncbi:MAG: DUF883 family protein [Verrucomicrobiota bacterium]
MTESSSETKDKLVSDIKQVIADAEILTKETAGTLSGKAKEAREKLELRLGEAKSQLHQLEGTVREKATEGAKETDRMIREHPYESLGVAFGMGVLIGVLLNRK